MPTLNEELSDRELEILRLLATGASNKEIASQLFISTNTVKVHLRNIFTKIGVDSRTDAALYALQTGIAAVPPSLTEEKAFPGGESMVEAVPAAVELLPEKRLPASRIALMIVMAVGVVSLVAYLAWRIGGAASAVPPASSDIQARWDVRAKLPASAYGLALGGYEGFLYAIGGNDGAGPTGAVYRYDPGVDAWEPRASKPTPVYEVMAAVVGGEVYVPGGRTGESQAVDVLEIYDPRSDTWRRGPDLPVALSGYALAAFEGRLYLFGGWDGRQVTDTVYRFDPSSDTWDEIGKLPSARAYSGAAVVGSRIFLLGGYNGRRALDENLVYQPALATEGEMWGTAQPLPLSRYGMGIASIAEIIDLVGGRQSEEKDVLSLSFFPFTESWQEFGTLASGTPYLPGATIMGNYLHVVGGQVDGSPSDLHQVYQAVYTNSLPIIR